MIIFVKYVLKYFQLILSEYNGPLCFIHFKHEILSTLVATNYYTPTLK